MTEAIIIAISIQILGKVLLGQLMAADDVLGELRISISLVLAQTRHLGPECSDFVHLPWSSEVIRGHQEASALAHSGRVSATCSMVPNYLPHAGRACATCSMVPFFFSICNQWPSVPITCATCSMVPFLFFSICNQRPSVPITCATCSMVPFLFSNLV